MIVACGNNQCESCTNKCASTSAASNKNEEGVEKAVRNAYEYYFFLLNEEEKANAQDFTAIDKSDVEITECKDNNAKANVKFKNLGEMTTVTLRLEYDEEIGNWLIANFIDKEGNASLLESMIEFLSK